MTKKDRYYIWLMGGLGNQLFQINTGKYLSKKGLKIKYVTNLIQNNFFTEKILKWKIHANLIDSFVKDLDFHNHPNYLPPILAKLKVNKNFSYYYPSVIDTRSLSTHIFGYFQDNSFNKKLWFEDDLELKRPKVELKNRRIMHLRFTDANNFGDNIKFYKTVIQENRSEDFLVCTDDINYAKSFLDKEKAFNFQISNGTPMDDFYLLTSAKELVIAPSSFSWWAGKLNNSLQKYWISTPTISQFGLPKQQEECQIIPID